MHRMQSIHVDWQGLFTHMKNMNPPGSERNIILKCLEINEFVLI